MDALDAETLKAQARREFGARAEAYVRSTGHAQGDDLMRLVELADPRPETEALDVATGGGHTALLIAQRACSVVASDLCQDMLDSAEANIRKKGLTNVRFQVADAEALPFSEGSFDLLTCRIAPHHFPAASQAVREWARVLRPGGRVALEDSVVPQDPDLDAFMNTLEQVRDYTHVRSYTEPEWRSFFESAGLLIMHTETVRKQHPLRDWLDRGAMRDPARDTARIEHMLQSAPPRVQEAFDLSYDPDGRPLSFTDEKILILAVKPAH